MDRILDKIADFLIFIDDFVVGKFERFSNWTQKWIGLNSVVWGKTCIVYYAAEISFRSATNWSWWNLIFLPIMGMIFLTIYRAFDFKRPKIGDCITANPFKIIFRPYRFGCLIMLWLDIYVSISAGRPNGGLGFTLALYFLAVDDLPSQPSKLRLWLESLMPEPLPQGASARTNPDV